MGALSLDNEPEDSEWSEPVSENGVDEDQVLNSLETPTTAPPTTSGKPARQTPMPYGLGLE